VKSTGGMIGLPDSAHKNARYPDQSEFLICNKNILDLTTSPSNI
jgi:hypothetical protein